MLNVAVIGASGNAGGEIVKELSARGHKVTAIARHPEKIPAVAGVSPVQGDINAADFASLLKGHDAVVSAVHFTDSRAEALVAAVKDAGVKRYLVVGGAASLQVAPGEILLNDPGFPEIYRAEATAGKVFLDYLRGVTDLDWVFLSPSAVFEHGERTGEFRLGKDDLLANEQGSRITFEDYAIAMVNEIEQPQHHQARFTVGY